FRLLERAPLRDRKELRDGLIQYVVFFHLLRRHLDGHPGVGSRWKLRKDLTAYTANHHALDALAHRIEMARARFAHRSGIAFPGGVPGHEAPLGSECNIV